MSMQVLLARIEALPPERRAEVEDFVDFLTSRSANEEGSSTKRVSSEYIKRINARRQQLFEEHGLFDTVPIIRELRETGG